ncbi:Histone-lysine N-methyltransferase EHMT2-like isoform X4 [Aphelenchoides fujianensis]|nr:Histone-lysine N-methyltransferase EHMT2-like isoform X4 [Aphelenchoides fujianensis]
MGVLSADLSGGVEPTAVPLVNNVDESRPAPFAYVRECVFREPPPPTAEQPAAECSCSANHDEAGALRLAGERPVLRECGRPDCRFPLFRRGLARQLEVYFHYGKQMWAVRARERIPKDAFVVEYAGEMTELRDEEPRTMPEDANDDYIFEVDTGDCEELFGRRRAWTIDAARFGNVARFLNHSCRPNVRAVRGRVGVEPVVRCGLFAARQLEAGEELTLDYGVEWWAQKAAAVECNCQQAGCRWGKPPVPSAPSSDCSD